MNDASSYVSGVVRVATPAFILAAILAILGYQNMPKAAAGSAVFLVVFGVIYPRETAEAFKDSIEHLGVIALVLVPFGVAVFGLRLFRDAAASGSVLMLPAGAALTVGGFQLTKWAVKNFILRPPPEPVVQKPLPIPRVEVVRPPGSPPKPKPAPTPEPLVVVKPPPPRQWVMWGGRKRLAAVLDQGSYMISSPPGFGKSALMRLFMKLILKEVLEPGSKSVLICFDPKRECYAWLASQMPKEKDSQVPLRLFCPSDQRTWTLEWPYDFYSAANRDTFALSMAPKNPNLLQQFFENAFRTLTSETAGAICRRMGRWDVRLLMLVLAYPGFIKRMVGRDKYADFVKQLLSVKSQETGQNIQMEITTKIALWLKVAAHLSHVQPERTLSLERFLSKPGVLVIQKDDDFREQHNAINAMLLQRLCQMLMKLQKDPTGKRKIYIVLDEFPSLGYIPGMVDMFRELRSRGVVFLVIWQSWANMEHVWKEEAYSIQGCLQNFIVLGSADPKDAEHAAKLIGKVRGYEGQKSSSRTDGETEGTGDTTGEGRSKGTGKQESWTDTPVSLPDRPWFGTQRSHTRGTSEQEGTSTNTSHTDSRSKSHSDTEGVTWVYFDRDIKSPTDIMRSPFPSKEGGFHGIAHSLGDPDVHDFHYESEFLEREGLFEKNDEIPDYWEWPERYQLIERLRPGELARLGLSGIDPSDPEAYPTPDESDEQARLPEQAAGPIQQGPLQQPPGPIQETQAQEPAAPTARDYGPIDWDGEPRDIDDDPEDDEPEDGAESCSPDDFLNDQ